MFGYVKPIVGELLVREHEFYRSVYCGICRSMKKHTGVLSNVTLTYDSVFLALVRMLYIDESDFKAKARRCIAHPLKKRAMLEENAAIEYTARAFAILTYHKFKDDIHDERGLKKLLTSLVNPITSRARGLSGLPALSVAVAEKMAEISRLEDEGCPSVDRVSAVFGELLGEIFANGLSDEERLVPYELGYHLGKFIYAADAAEDYEKDIRCGSYNPYVISYGGASLTEENRETIRCALILECKRIEAAANLLPYGKRATIENIINNVIYLGLVKRIEFLSRDSEKEKSLKEKKN